MNGDLLDLWTNPRIVGSCEKVHHDDNFTTDNNDDDYQLDGEVKNTNKHCQTVDDDQNKIIDDQIRITDEGDQSETVNLRKSDEL